MSEIGTVGVNERYERRSGRRAKGWEFVEHGKRRAAVHVHGARTHEDMEAVEDLWNAVYGQEFGWLDPTRSPHHEDRYHPYSTYLLAKVDGRPVGTMRLVLDSPEGLPVEQFVPIADLRGDKRLIECQRLMVLPSYRSKRWSEMPFGVFSALIKGCVHWCIVNGVTHILADVFLNTKTTPRERLIALGCRETGKEFIDTELNEPDKSTALLLTVGELFARSFRTTSPFYRYLMEYDEHVDVYD